MLPVHLKYCLWQAIDAAVADPAGFFFPYRPCANHGFFIGATRGGVASGGDGLTKGSHWE
jgi:hypothetical protein